MRLGVKVGQGCASLLDAKMRDLPCHRLEFDEIRGFIGKKARHVVRSTEDAVRAFIIQESRIGTPEES
jgi:hypothetical protein